MENKNLVELKKKEDGKNYIYIDDDLYKLLLKSARTSQKGRRGLSSRKSRVRKKIITKEINLSIERGLNMMKKDGEI